IPSPREGDSDALLALLEQMRQLGPGELDDQASPPIQQTLGRFQIQRELGRGGQGIVFLAHDPRLDREVALKIPHPHVLITEERQQRFLREARAAAGLDHPNLVPVYEVGHAGPVCYIVSAYCPGPDLRKWLRQWSVPIPVA